MDVLTREQRQKNMAAIKNKDTKIEIILRKALWKNKVRYRKNWKNLPGKPDIVITKYKIAVFCDGDFWHGKDFDRKEIKTNTKFWKEKLKSNIERDLRNTIILRDMGWSVIRFWESDIKKNLDECVKKVLDLIEKNKM